MAGPVKNAPKAMPAISLRVLLIAAGCAMLCAIGQGAPVAKGQHIPELRLKNGASLHDVTVVAVGSTTIIAKWDGGQGSIRLAQLPDDLTAGLAQAAPQVPPPAAPPAAVPAASDAKVSSMELPTEIKLTNGFVMHNSSVVRWQADGVLVNYQGGTVLVLFKNISPEQRAIFGARRDEAMTQQAKADARMAGAPRDPAAAEAQAKQDEEAKARVQAEAKAEEIKNGMSFHYLVKGMTKDQVRESFGVPQEDHGDSYFYIARGLDKYGNSANRTLTFKDDILVGWQDMREGEPKGAVTH